MSECNHDCSSCKESCSSRTAPADMHIETNPMSSVKKVIGIVSGKGGVGKSLVTSMLAVQAKRRDYNTAILDADITGPSIPNAFGLHSRADSDGTYLYPVITKTGIAVMTSEAASSGVYELALIVAAISMSLGFMNLLPIPPFDGGKILIELIQLVIRRPLPQRAIVILSYVGMAFILFVFIVVLRNDVVRLVLG